MKLSELDEITQYDICKAVARGEFDASGGVVMVSSGAVELPNIISTRYECVECSKILNKTIYLADIKNVSKRVPCHSCGSWAAMHFMGTSISHEMKRITRSVQKKITDFNHKV